MAKRKTNFRRPEAPPVHVKLAEFDVEDGVGRFSVIEVSCFGSTWRFIIKGQILDKGLPKLSNSKERWAVLPPEAKRAIWRKVNELHEEALAKAKEEKT